MPKMISVVVLPDRQVDHRDVVISDIVAVVPDNAVAIYYGSTVPEHRALEMVNGWMKLWNGLRDRNLLAITNVGTGHLYSAMDIENLTEEERRTSWGDTTPVTTSDIALGVSYQVAEQLQATNMVQSTVDTLIGAAREEIFLKG